MELSDLIQDIEATKVASIGLIGGATGALSRVINFEERIEKSKNRLFSKENDEVEKEGLKYFISFIGGLTSVEYRNGLSSGIGQAVLYVTEFRLAYEAGYRLVDKYI